ncbi:hypothetical protein [Chlorogloeopsis sp. ULAP02]
MMLLALPPVLAVISALELVQYEANLQVDGFLCLVLQRQVI